MSDLERARRAWARGWAGLSQAQIDRRARAFSDVVRAIASQGAVSAERFAELVAVDESDARDAAARLAGLGVQTDDAGRVVGAALTLRETPHRVRLRGRVFHAWCSLDTLFIPGLLDETAEVESRCAATGDAVRLTVAPDAIRSREPAETWLSVVLPGDSPPRVGPESPT